MLSRTGPVANYLLWGLLSLAGLSGYSQTPTQRLDRRLAIDPPEKLFLQTDKPYYTPGDTIWLSAFAVTGADHLPVGTSQVAYVQLLNDAGTLVTQRILRLTTGRGQADLALPDSLPAGDYQLVAFTNWMRNAPESFFFHQNLHLWRGQPAARQQPAAPLPLALQFFPEGGQLVAGIPSRVAFNVLNSRGQSVAIRGTVTEAEGQAVSIPFGTTHNGMGLFFLTPQAGRQYIARLTDGSTYPLPPVQPQGRVIWVTNLPGQHAVRVTVYNQPGATGESTLLAHLRGQVCFEAVVPNAATAIAQIPYDRIPADGILTVTLFDEHRQPRCERLVFINQHRQLRIRAAFDKEQYAPREPVTMNVTVTDSAGQPVVADVAVAVTDADRVVLPGPYADQLVSNLLLTADLPGYVEQPAYYVDPAEPNAARDADLLLMTQGWRRFVWEQADTTPVFRREAGLTVTGRVTRPAKTPAPGGQVLLIAASGADSRVAYAAVDSVGRFAVTDIDLPGPIRVVANWLTQRGRQAPYCLIDPRTPVRVHYQPQPAPDSLTVPALFLRAEQERAQVAEMYRFTTGRTLSVVDVKAKRKAPYLTDSRRIKLGEPDAVATQGNLPAATYLDILRQSTAGNRVYAKIMTGSAPVYVFVDGVSVALAETSYNYADDGNLLGSLLPNQIAQIDIITNPAKIGVLSGTGTGLSLNGGLPAVINILTKRGESTPGEAANTPAPTSLTATQLPGFSPVREFYVPRYTPDTAVDPNHPDSRTTLFWAPRLTTNPQGQATITFPNNDHTTRLRAVINGLSPDGRAGSVQVELNGKQ